MPKYLCLQRNLPGNADATASPAEMHALYEQFNAWREKFRGQLIDLGGKLVKGQLVTAHPVPDGPLVELKELVGGYMIVSAENLEEAVELARQCPGLVCDGSGVEVIEIRTP